jgi:DNA-binding CsgD family transcriptional regulator
MFLESVPAVTVRTLWSMSRPGVVGHSQWQQARQRIERIAEAGGDDRSMRMAVLDQIRRVVPFDAHVWVTTDPLTAVGASPLAAVPSLRDLPALIRLKYLTSVNRWTALPADRAVTLVAATSGDLGRSRLWRELLDEYGVRDVASAVFGDRHGCWGFLDLWRSGSGDIPFSAPEVQFLSGVLPSLTRALRLSAATTFTVPVTSATPEGPAVLLLTDTLEPGARTPRTDARLRALLPTPPGQSPVPAVALNVAAQLLAVESGVDGHEPAARLHEGAGRWVEVRAARLDPNPDPGATIAVTIERTTSARRLEIYCRAVGLTARESELVEHLVSGADTRETARALGIGEQTVNDHLRAVFAKAGVNSRRQLIANATG